MISSQVATSFEDALEMARQGRAPEAESLLRAAVTRTEDGSPERTRALFELANLLVACGDLRRAVDPLRTAVAMKSTDQEHEMARLTGTMNLGEILARLGELDEANAVLTAGLEGRRVFYGEDHAGYGYGLESLAKIQAARGEIAGAIGHINKAVSIFWDTGNERIASAFATRAPIVKAAGGQAFNQLEGLPDPLFDRMVSDVLQADDVEPALQLEVLTELAYVVAHRKGGGGWMPQVHAALSNTARDAGSHLARIKSLTWLREHMDRTRDTKQALGIVLALALAEDEAGDTASAEAYYKDAELRAATDEREHARVARNYGLFLSQHERKDEARTVLSAALGHARAANDESEIGQAAIAQGILLQHMSDPAAGPLLEEAIRLLPVDHADALCARSHLIALRTGAGCGCGDMSEALSAAVLEMVKESVPGDLIADLSIHVSDQGPPDVQVKLAREPSPEEIAALDSAVNLAVVQLQSSIRRRGLSTAK